MGERVVVEIDLGRGLRDSDERFLWETQLGRVRN